MLSNEQRAHDLAILMVQWQLSPEVAKAKAREQDVTIEQDEVVITVNIEEAYFKAYDLALSAMKERFA